MHFQLATIDVVDELAKMNQALIRDEGHRNRMSLEELQVRMEGLLTGGYHAVTFHSDDAITGYALYKPEPEWVYLRQFFVKPEYRRQGFGRTAFNWLRTNVWKDCPRLRVDVLVGNEPAIAFWRSLGFLDYCLTMELDLDQKST